MAVEGEVGAAKETGRLEAFSDGVFAIAVTLLVLDLKVPAVGGGGLAAALLAQWPAYLAYLISFLTILIMWINHHLLFRQIARTDHTFLLLNGLLLLAITVVPFPTAVLAEFIRGPDARSAALLYSGTYVAIAVAFNLLWRHASREGRLLDGKADLRVVRAISQGYRFGPLLYLAALLLAFVSVAASVALCALLAVFFALPPRAGGPPGRG